MPRVTAADFPAWLMTYPIEYLECRVMGHRWDEHGSFLSKVAAGLIGNHLTCTCCKAERFDAYDVKNGLLWARDYHRPDGYEIEGDNWVPKATYIAVWHHRNRKTRQMTKLDPRWQSASERAMRRYEDDDPITKLRTSSDLGRN